MGNEKNIVKNWFTTGVALGNLLDNERTFIFDLRENCIALVESYNVIMVDTILEKFVDQYIIKIMSQMKIQRESLKKQKLYNGEEDVFRMSHFDVVDFFRDYLSKMKADVKKEIDFIQFILNDIKMDEDYHGKEENMHDTTVELSKKQRLNEVLYIVAEVFAQKYPETVVNEISRK